MSEQEPGPSQNPYGQPTDPYGQPANPNPYGQAPAPNPYGQPYGEQPQSAYGQQPPAPYGSPYTPATTGDARPGGVTAAGWITIILSGLSAAMFGLVAVLFLVARDQIVTEMNKSPEFRDLDIDGDSIVGVMVAFMLVLVLWAAISMVLGIFVLRRSNVSRILLVISAAVVAVGSLLGITSVISAVWLIASVAVIVLLFVNGAGDWFNRTPNYPGGPGGYGGYQYGGQQGPYNPSGTPGEQPYGEQPYGGTPPQQGGTDYPPTDYPNR